MNLNGDIFLIRLAYSFETKYKVAEINIKEVAQEK